MLAIPTFYELLQCLGIMLVGALICTLYSVIYDFLYHRSN